MMKANPTKKGKQTYTSVLIQGMCSSELGPLHFILPQARACQQVEIWVQ